MSVFLNSTHHHHDSRGIHQKAMTISYPDHLSHPYGLITPPSEMRSNIDVGADEAAVADPNILGPPSNSRYYLRKQPPPQSSSYSIINNSYQNNNYNPYLQVRRRSGSSSTTVTSSAGSSTIPRPISPPLDLESRDFNIGEFTATVFRPLMTVIDCA
jgi:hypothetical protein